MVLGLVTDPDGFFASRADSRALLGPIAVVVLAGIGGALPAAVATVTLDPIPATKLSGAVIASSVLAFLQVVVLWIVLGVVVLLLSRVVGGRITMGDTLAAMGWGFLPIALGGAARGLGTYLALQGAEQPTVGGEGGSIGITFAMRVLRGYLDQAAGEPAFLGSVLVAFGCVAWGGYLWAVGIEHFGEDFDRRDAAIVAGVPAVAYAALLVAGVS